jgi:hypothetical protein
MNKRMVAKGKLSPGISVAELIKRLKEADQDSRVLVCFRGMEDFLPCVGTGTNTTKGSTKLSYFLIVGGEAEAQS